MQTFLYEEYFWKKTLNYFMFGSITQINHDMNKTSKKY